MELLIVMLVLLAIFGGGGLVSHTVPFGRWSFSYGGRAFEVRNYVFREVLLVDGEPVEGTWVAGDRMSWAEHAIALPDGRQLNLRIDSTGFTMRCNARVGEQVIFDSQAAGSAGREATAQLPGGLDLSPETVSSVEALALDQLDDPRWDAAQVLLADLRAEPVLSATAQELGEELGRALTRLAAGQKAAVAHEALGGASEELLPVLQRLEQAVEERLALLRELHLAASSQAPSEDALPDVRDALTRLQTERELEEMEREAKRLAQARQAAAGRSRR